MPLFIKNFVHFGLFTNEMECKRGKQGFSNKVIFLNAASFLIFQYKNARKTSLKKFYTIGLFQLLQRQICQGNRQYVLPENQDCI